MFFDKSSIIFLQIFLTFSFIAVKQIIGQTPAIGACPNVLPMFDIDLKKFQGEWHEVERTFYIFETVSNCVKFNFSLNTDGTMDVKVAMINRITGNPNKYTGVALPDYFRNPSVMDFRLNSRFIPTASWIGSRIPNSVIRILPGSGRYIILNTDYTNYAIMWSCSDMGMFHTDLVWVLGRQTDLDTEKRSEVYTILSESNLDVKRLVLSKQRDCPAYSFK